MEKQINQDMVKQFGTKTKETETYETNQNIEWVNTKDYKRMIKFRIFPANSKENGWIGGAFSSGAHWLEHNGERVRYQCPEHTFPNSGVVCPVCQMRRDLKKAGYTDAELSKDGRFGPENIFQPRLSSTIKCVVIETDLKKNWDKSHISLLQQNGKGMLNWLTDEYTNPENPNFTDWEKGGIIKFSRNTDNGKWDRVVLPDSIAFNLWNAPAEVVNKVKEENEAITTSELFHLANDEQTIKVREILESIKAEIVAKRASGNTASTVEPVASPVAPAAMPESTNNGGFGVDDSIPF